MRRGMDGTRGVATTPGPWSCFPCRHPTSLGVGILHPRGSMAGKPLSRIELLQGTLDLIILQALRWGPRHGYGLVQLIRAGSGDVLQVDTGSLYPALHRLEHAGA